jgi:hypothetical protein
MKKLLFIPQYIGEMKYYEKLLPILKGRAEVVFLFIPKTTQDNYLEEMVQYADKNNYPYLFIGERKIYRNKLFDLFFQPPLWYIYKNECENLIRKISPYAILATTDTGFYHHCLFSAASNMGVKTCVIQWNPIGPPGLRIQSKVEALKIQQAKMRPITRWVKRALYSYTRNISIPMAGILGFDARKLPIMGLGPSQKLGVINKISYNVYKDAGVKENKISIVGSPDFDTSKEVSELLLKNDDSKTTVARKYKINIEKVNISLYAVPFYSRDMTILNEEEQKNYYFRICELIRKVFSLDEAHILLKMHPSENKNIYKPLEAFGLSIYDKSAANEELISLSDIYISGPSTSNYIPITMQKHAIFINFLDVPSVIVDQFKESYGIKKVISDKAEFIKLLNDFKLGKLQRQYTDGHIIRDGRCRERIREWLLS